MIEKIRSMSKALFDAVPIQVNDDDISRQYGICSHPFTNTIYNVNPKTGVMIRLDTKKGYEIFKESFHETLDKIDAYMIFNLVNKPYKLTWFKYCNKYFNEKDYAQLLKASWLEEENPNQDVNVSLKEVISYFKKANKTYLMEPEDYKYFKNLPEKIKVYRGVGKGRKKWGLSWTDNKEKAIWFKDRFKQGGELLEVNINKKYVLAYFNDRNENEVIVDISKLKDAEEIEE